MSEIIDIFKKSLSQNIVQKNWFESYLSLVGDIHNHCNISYGHGDLKDAIFFANQQLDFFSVTGHFAWPDMNDNMEKLSIPEDVIEYHNMGFALLLKNWGNYINQLQKINEKELIAFPSYEFHSFNNGDYTVVAKKINEQLPKNNNLFDNRLNDIIEGTFDKSNILAFPHHIGYKCGYRGINWETYNEKNTPLVEIISMHGSSESEDSNIKYLHTMGPLNGKNTMLEGFKGNHRFGIIGNTDHHNASPGSYPHGRTIVWAKEKNRDCIFDSLKNRITAAVSGDPIKAMMFVDNYVIGQEIPEFTEKRNLDIYIIACDTIDKAQIIQSGKIIKTITTDDNNFLKQIGRFAVNFGWGEKNKICNWTVNISIDKGTISNITPRFKGEDIVDPLDDANNSNKIIPNYNKIDSKKISLNFSTEGNINSTTNSTQGISLEYNYFEDSTIKIEIEALYNGKVINKEYQYPIRDLKYTKSEYIDGFVSPAIEIKKFINLNEYALEYHSEIKCKKNDWYYLRIFEKNGDVMYLSPIWEKPIY